MAARYEIDRRVKAAQATLDRFKDHPFAFGKNDCARLVAFHLRKLGYRPSLAKAGSYKTALSARAALKRAGYESLADALDGLGLPRIPPAAAVVGDVLQIPAVDAFGALAVAMGNGRVLGYHQDTVSAVVMQPLAFEAAWRVVPR